MKVGSETTFGPRIGAKAGTLTLTKSSLTLLWPGTSSLAAVPNLVAVRMWGLRKVLTWNQLIRLLPRFDRHCLPLNDWPRPLFGSAIGCGGGTRGCDGGTARGDCAPGRPS